MCEENKIVDEKEEVTNELVTTSTQEIIQPTTTSNSIVDINRAIEEWEAYQTLCDKLLDSTDFQAYGKGKDRTTRKKKSAWRKLGKAFNVSIEPVHEEIVRDDDGRIITATYQVKASTQDGRYTVGLGSCSIYDKATMKNPNHEKYLIKGENVPEAILRLSFSNAEHDVPATAYTRAVNRAISDHIGCGEVSAEEIGPSRELSSLKRKKLKPKTKTTKTKESKTETEVIEAEIVKESKTETEVKKLTSEQVNELKKNGHIAKRIKDKEENLTNHEALIVINSLYEDKKITKKIKDELENKVNNF